MESCRNQTVLGRDDLRAVIRLLTTPRVGPRTLSRFLDACLQDGNAPAEVVAMPADELTARYGLPLACAESWAETEETVDPLQTELEERSIRILVRGWVGYPERLVTVRGSKAPPVLFAYGNLSVLENRAVGFCGSRKASERGIAAAETSAQALAGSGLNIVSGYANGVDLAAHRGALAAGGVTTLVLAEGILHFRLKLPLRDLVSEANLLVLSEFPPRLPWSTASAMMRNQTICALSDALIIVESGTEGGTFESGKVALEQKCPLFVVEYAEPSALTDGSAYFLAHGAAPLRCGDIGNVILDPVVSAVMARRLERDNCTTQMQMSFLP